MIWIGIGIGFVIGVVVCWIGGTYALLAPWKTKG